MGAGAAGAGQRGVVGVTPNTPIKGFNQDWLEVVQVHNQGI